MSYFDYFDSDYLGLRRFHCSPEDPFCTSEDSPFTPNESYKTAEESIYNPEEEERKFSR